MVYLLKSHKSADYKEHYSPDFVSFNKDTPGFETRFFYSLYSHVLLKALSFLKLNEGGSFQECSASAYAEF